MEVKQIATRIPKEDYVKLKTYCAENDLSIQDVLIAAFNAEMKKRGIK